MSHFISVLGNSASIPAMGGHLKCSGFDIDSCPSGQHCVRQFDNNFQLHTKCVGNTINQNGISSLWKLFSR